MVSGRAADSGGYRDKVPAYGSTMCGDELEGGLRTPEDYGNFAKALVAKGYTERREDPSHRALGECGGSSIGGNQSSNYGCHARGNPVNALHYCRTSNEANRIMHGVAITPLET